MQSNRPYLIRAMFDWIVDNDWTPHLQVDANYPNISIPTDYVQDGLIVLNTHPNAVRELQFTNEWFSFKARFQGVEMQLGFPPEAVLAIFARENGQGMPFPAEPYPEAESEEASPMAVVESSNVESVAEEPEIAVAKEAVASDGEDAPADSTTDKAPRKKAHLSIVK